MLEFFGVKILYEVAAFVTAGMAILVSIFSIIYHRKVVDRKEMDEIRKRIEEHQKQYLEAQKKNDTIKLKKLEQEQAEVLSLLKKNMLTSMKPALITLPIVLIIIWILSYFYGSLGPLIDLPFSIPFLTHPLEEAGIVNGMDWFGLYLISAISISLILELILRKIFKI